MAFALADAADGVALREYRSSDLVTVDKVDGTPVAEVDVTVEQAMADILAKERPTDSVVGEEIGERPGRPERRWILDGIDGTHNYEYGWPGWGTIIGLEVDGAMEVSVVSAPALGRRWWAQRDRGAWTAEYEPGHFDAATGTRMHCTRQTVLDDASVIVIPWVGLLHGWRSDVAARFVPPRWPRSESFAIDTARAASGDVDVAILTLGGIWDLAPTALMIREAGGVFRDAWGGERFDTATGVFTNAALADQAIAAIADLRPPEPDRPRLAKLVSGPLDPDADVEGEDGWRAFGIRPLQSMSARRRVEHAPPVVLNIVDERAAQLDRPFLGITTDGRARSGLRTLEGPRVPTEPIVDAALAFLQALTVEQRTRASFLLDAAERRMWINVHMNHFRHGVMLEDLPSPVRELGLDILRATLSARAFDQARSIMRINELLAELSGDHDAFGEWPYFVSIFGSPGGDEPWAWQIDGHHLCINTVVFDGRIVMTPAFMGAEPRRIHRGPLAGTSLFDPEERFGLDLIRSFDARQRTDAILYPSLHPDEIPAHLQNLFDGRIEAGAFHDNAILPYQGVAGSDMSDAQRRVLLGLADTYVGWSADEHTVVRRREVVAHLDETWFSWYGGTGDHDPFYYRVHSPVILIEFDHHPGVVFDNEVPSRHHVHTVLRTPNGGDYGADLLRLHHERYDHAHGDHADRDHNRDEPVHRHH
jgi:fructose-1,6-bisphosphatase/inositol monophosphatase family enzyme